ncbi:unnamed protein product, partial [Symbiodinium pilosum]
EDVQKRMEDDPLSEEFPVGKRCRTPLDIAFRHLDEIIQGPQGWPEPDGTTENRSDLLRLQGLMSSDEEAEEAEALAAAAGSAGAGLGVSPETKPDESAFLLRWRSISIRPSDER